MERDSGEDEAREGIEPMPAGSSRNALGLEILTDGSVTTTGRDSRGVLDPGRASSGEEGWLRGSGMERNSGEEETGEPEKAGGSPTLMSDGGVLMEP